MSRDHVKFTRRLARRNKIARNAYETQAYSAQVDESRPAFGARYVIKSHASKGVR